MAFDAAAYNRDYKRMKRADPEYRRSELDRDNARNRQRRLENPEKARAKDREQYRRNPEKWRRSCWKKLGVTPETWETLFKVQGGKCAICKALDPGSVRQHWHTDHDHVTGKVRGILCNHCNHMLGAGRDNPDYLREGAKYLEESK